MLLLEAPAGFGKTALLAQWRRQWLQRGVSVAWLALDERDEGMRFISAIQYAVSAASSKLSLAVKEIDSAKDAMAAATRWLANVAAMAAPLALILDDIHTLQDPGARSLLGYIVCNAPANLTLALASRTKIELPVARRAGNSTWCTLDARALRMTSAETTEVLAMRFGKGMNKDMAARLHETSEGWVLGLQLMSSTIEQEAAAGHSLDLAQRAAQGGGQYFMEFLLNRLSHTAVDLLLRNSLVDAIHPGLCVELTGRAESAAELEQLRESTPVLDATVGGDWMKMHPLAREVLRVRALEILAPDELQLIHERAADWLARRGLDEQAAHHALAAGQVDRAYELAERCLYSLALDGHVGRARAQLDRIPLEVLLSRPRLALAGAFVRAFGEPDAQAGKLIAAVRAEVDLPAEIKREAVAVEIILAFVQESYDRAAELVAELEEAYPTGSADLDQRILNQGSLILLLTGQPHLARHRCTRGAPAHVTEELSPGRIACVHLVGRSYLWEGKATLAADVLGPASDDVRRKLGRRNRYSIMLDTTLAAALWDLDQPDAAAALLADRLDVIAAEGLPFLVSRGLITASRIAAWEGHEARRLDLLDYLCTLAETRNSPWMMLEALSELIAVHSRAGRAHSSTRLLQRASAAHADALRLNSKTLAPLLDLRLCISQVYTCIANREFREALRYLERAVPRASELRRGQDYIECRLLQVLSMHRLGEDTGELLRESINLAGVLGLKRIMVDTHPELAGLASDVSHDVAHLVSNGRIPVTQRSSASVARWEDMVAPTELLTPKEREVLGLLSQGLQNKEIAAASAVGQETVKWHIKNLFAKLGASSRRHAVARARMLGILAVED